MGDVSKNQIALDNLADALVQNIMTASDEEILEDLQEEGCDPDQLTADMLALFQKAKDAHERRV